MNKVRPSILATFPRAATAALFAALAVGLAGACSGEAPEAAAPAIEAPAAEGHAAGKGRAPTTERVEERAAAASPGAAAAAEAEAEHGGCEMPPEGSQCDCAGKGMDQPVIGDAIEEVSPGAAPVRGPAGAPVTIVVFSDMECPFCTKLWAGLREIEEEYAGKLRIAVRHRPLPFHANARDAARATLAAAAQGRFWEYHDALMEGGRKVDAAALDRRAAEVGLDPARLRRDMQSAEVEAAVAADEAAAVRLGVAGTPTLFVNGRRIVGAQPKEVIREAIDQALAQR